MSERADQIIAEAKSLREEVGAAGPDNATALAQVLGVGASDDVARVLRDGLEDGATRVALSHVGDPRYRDLLMLETGIELGVAAERVRGRGE